MNNYTDLFSSIGYYFKDEDLIKRALTHSSVSDVNYEKLEFLGDSILDFLIAEYIYTNYHDMNEGEMTRIRAGVVSKEPLAEISDKLGLVKYLNYGDCVASLKMKSDIYEAVLAAIYLDGGIGEATGFLNRTLMPVIAASEGIIDYKSRLIEHCVRHGISYEFVVTDSGPQHKKVFQAELYLNGISRAHGKGRSKKEAEQEASKQAYTSL